MLYLGIDQHKSQLTVNLRNEDGSVILKRQVSAPGCHCWLVQKCPCVYFEGGVGKRRPFCFLRQKSRRSCTPYMTFFRLG
jgi:hypothetical protein